MGGLFLGLPRCQSLPSAAHARACPAPGRPPHTHLEFIRHHVSQALVVHHPNVHVHGEGLACHAADHHLHMSEGQRGQWEGGRQGACGSAGACVCRLAGRARSAPAGAAEQATAAARAAPPPPVAPCPHLPSVAGEPRLLQQRPHLSVVHRLALVARLEGRGVHKLAAAGWHPGGGRGAQGQGDEITAAGCCGRARGLAIAWSAPPPSHPPHLSAPALPVRLSISMPMVMREGKACGLISRSGLRRSEGGGGGAVEVGWAGQREWMATPGHGGTEAASIPISCSPAQHAAGRARVRTHRMPVDSQKGMSMSSNRRDSTPFCP